MQSEWEYYPYEINGVLVQFRERIWQLWRQADRERLLGSALLLACQRVVNTGPAECQALLGSLCELDVQAPAVCAAAEHLAGLLTAPTGTAPIGAALESSDVASDSATIREVTVSFCDKCCVLRAPDRQPLTLTVEESACFTRLARLVALEAPTGLVTWESVADSIAEKSKEWWTKQHPRAAKMFSLLKPAIPRLGNAAGPRRLDWNRTWREGWAVSEQVRDLESGS